MFVRSILEASSIVWSPHHKKKFEQIENVQKTFTRLIYYRCFPNKSYPAALPSYNDRLKRLHLDSLELRRKAADLCMFYKIWSLNSRLRFSDMFTLKPCRGRVSCFEIYVPFIKRRTYDNFFSSRIAKMVAHLPGKFFSKKQNISTILLNNYLNNSSYF